MKRRALFLDRDGVINIDKGYVYRKEDIEFVDGVFELVRMAKSLGYVVIVVTNQAGIGRGYYSTEQFWALMEWISERFRQNGGALDGTHFCPDHPIYGVGEYKRESFCRKPAPGMLLSAIRDWDIDKGKSILIGDKMSDIQAGNTAGVGVNLLFNPAAEENYQPVIHHLSQAKMFLSSSAFIVPE